MILDSGALGSPLLFGSNMADDLGLDRQSLDFSQRYAAINGEGSAAFVTLPEITLLGLTFRDVPAVITQAPQTEGLIGAEILHHLNFTTTPGYCSLSMPVEAARMTARARRPVR
jgi:predicted aspartyl protease